MRNKKIPRLPLPKRWAFQQHTRMWKINRRPETKQETTGMVVLTYNCKAFMLQKTLNWSNNIGNIVMALIKQLVWQCYIVNKLQPTCTGRYMLDRIWEQYVNVDLSLWLVMIALLLSHILIEHILKRLRLV